MTYKVICKKCGKVYPTSYKFSKYCSEECRKIMTRDKSREKRGIKEVTRTCTNCGQNFKTYLKRQMYCNKECYSKSMTENYEKRSILGLRYFILVRDKFTCQYCGRTPQNGIILHVDHINPKSKGGENIKENLIAACEECNLGKNNRYFGEILTYLKNKDFTINKGAKNG